MNHLRTAQIEQLAGSMGTYVNWYTVGMLNNIGTTACRHEMLLQR